MSSVPPLAALARTPERLIEVKRAPVDFTIGDDSNALDVRLANFRRSNPHFNGNIVWQSDLFTLPNKQKIGTLHLDLPTRSSIIFLKTLNNDVNIKIIGNVLVEQMEKIYPQTKRNRYLYRKEKSCLDGERFEMSITLDEPFFTRMLFVKKGLIPTPEDQLVFKDLAL